jgi:hypothetical protein
MQRRVYRRPLLTTLALLGCTLCWSIGWWPALKAENPPVPSRDEAVAHIERLGGRVGIDGEAPDQPVWMVDLSEIQVTDATLTLLRAFPKLEVLQLHATGLQDAQLARIGALTTLRDLSLSDTKITDQGLRHLQGLKRLEHLSLHGTRTTDTGLQQLVGLPALVDLLHGETAITEAGLAAFHAARLAQVEPLSTGEQAAPTTDQPVRVEGRLAESLQALGRELFPTTRHDPVRRRQAVALLEAALRADPDNERIQLDLADAYLLLDQELTLIYAIELYEQVLRHRPSQTGLYGRLAEAYRRLGNADAAFALAAARGAAEVTEPFPAALQLADLAADSGDLSRGIAELDVLAKLANHHPGVELLRAALLREARQESAARSVAKAVLEKVDRASPYAAVAQRLLEGK